MPLFHVSASVVGSKYIGDFEAADEKAAIQLAIESDKTDICLCHHCADECEDPMVDEFFAEEIKSPKIPKED